MSSPDERMDQTIEDAEFQKLIVDALTKITLPELADGLHVSFPTLTRWSEGKNLPYRLVRPNVASYIQKKLEEING